MLQISGIDRNCDQTYGYDYAINAQYLELIGKEQTYNQNHLIPFEWLPVVSVD